MGEDGNLNEVDDYVNNLSIVKIKTELTKYMSLNEIDIYINDFINLNPERKLFKILEYLLLIKKSGFKKKRV